MSESHSYLTIIATVMFCLAYYCVILKNILDKLAARPGALGSGVVLNCR